MMHADLLKLLLPPVSVDPNGAMISKELVAEGNALDAAQASADTILTEMDPRTTSVLLSDWERVAGLPDPCVGTGQTTAQRQAALVAKITAVGGQSKQYFIDLAATLGYTITITEHRPFTVNSTVATAIKDRTWRSAFTVNAPQTTITPFTVKSTVSDPLAAWGNAALECVINRYKPAHTIALFAYS